MTPIELLAPARDLACGRAAIDHGADAVYMGGPAFGARAAAGNAIQDLEDLARYAHRFRSRLYMTLNTILFDHELDQAEVLCRQAWDAGVDGLIIQDLGLLELDLPPLPLIASTQMHNTDPAHVRFLEQAGFQRVILARELSLEEISAIRSSTTLELEAFVHGSLCVSYSGRCYLSACLGDRSANRGQCGQPCRLPWNLVDAVGRVLERGRHLLSLRDMDRGAFLGDLIDAGITCFKIEGRLKDAAYVKNVTAWYRKRLDEILAGRQGLCRASSGEVEFSFSPDPGKTFRRSGTTFFLHGEDDGVWSPDTPKSTGEELGTVTACGPDWFSLKSVQGINPGDGLCFFDRNRELKGLQVVGPDGTRIRVHQGCGSLRPGMQVFRNRDHRFLKLLEGKTAVRRVPLQLSFHETDDGFTIHGQDADGVQAQVALKTQKVRADNPGAALDTIRKQLSRLNDTMFSLASLTLDTSPCFLCTSELNRLRRDLVAALLEARDKAYVRPVRSKASEPDAPYPAKDLDYRFNIANQKAAEFYRRHGVCSLKPAFELEPPGPGAVVMTTRHCLRRCLGCCLKVRTGDHLKPPLFMEHEGHRFRLEFDCARCVMLVVME
jgi:putative protease